MFDFLLLSFFLLLDPAKRDISFLSLSAMSESRGVQ